MNHSSSKCLKYVRQTNIRPVKNGLKLDSDISTATLQMVVTPCITVKPHPDWSLASELSVYGMISRDYIHSGKNDSHTQSRFTITQIAKHLILCIHNKINMKFSPLPPPPQFSTHTLATPSPPKRWRIFFQNIQQPHSVDHITHGSFQTWQ